MRRGGSWRGGRTDGFQCLMGRLFAMSRLDSVDLYDSIFRMLLFESDYRDPNTSAEVMVKNVMDRST